MSTDDTRRILDLLAQGKITVDEADRLLKAVGAPAPADAPPDDEADGKRPRWLRIAIHKPANDHHREKNVNIRVPIAIVKGGMRLGALIAPLAGDAVAQKLRDRGFDPDLSKLDPAAVDALLKDLGEFSIDVDAGKKQVRITCE